MESVPDDAKRTVAGLNRRLNVVVVAWDMAHNAAGRAYLLADMLSEEHSVLLIGPLFKRFGSATWPPLRSSKVELRTFTAESLTDFMSSAMNFVEGIEADVVIACKPRMPSLVLALLLKRRLGCPVIVDIDDHELSFFNGAAPLSLQDARSAFKTAPDAADQPSGEVWTRLSETLAYSFEARAVSNVSLQRRFGGVIIRHARDERLYVRNSDVRSRVRAEFGYTDDDKVVLFLGSPRPHKGIFRIADALERVGTERLALCIIGTVTAKSILVPLSSYDRARIDMFPDQPWERLPDLIQLADGVCLLQDEASPVAQFQVPAKLTDALAVGVPVAITDVPPFADIPDGIVTVVRTDADLDFFVQEIAEGRTSDEAGERRRDYFLRELSYEVNRARLSALIAEAMKSADDWRVEWSEFLELVTDGSGCS